VDGELHGAQVAGEVIMPGSTSTIVPCIWFDGQAEQAAAFYTRIFPESRITATSHFPESGENPPGKPPGSVLTVEFELAGRVFTAINGGPDFTPNPSISFFVLADTPEKAERLYGVLADGGEALMPLDTYPWSQRYGWVKDRFGVSWQVMAGQREPGTATIVPCLMFAGTQHGRAEEAMNAYTRVFPESRVGLVERYAAGEGPPGTVKHGRFALAGQEMVAMDSHVSHDVTFSEALSLQVMCRDQTEIDHYWASLSEGGEAGPCGWLKDRFGVSWQVVPRNIKHWMTSTNAGARDRVFRAIMGMTKMDIAALARAFEGL
jgi:predicted 3-demethylubiquinone-9 3-methyltransferase (glyoxalase superfamily)